MDLWPMVKSSFFNRWAMDKSMLSLSEVYNSFGSIKIEVDLSSVSISLICVEYEKKMYIIFLW